MERRYFLRNTGILAGAGLFFSQNTFASLFSLKDYNLKMLRGDVGFFTERGGTIGFYLSKDGIIVVDAQFPDTAKHLIEALQKQSNAPFSYLLNTHHHGDHSSGNISFRGLVGHVAAHENSLKNQRATAEKAGNAEKQLFPDITFTEAWKLKTGNEKIQGYYFGPGHTNGDAVYHFEESNIIHTGDLVFNKRHPFVDRTAGANMQNWIKALDGIIAKSDKNTIFIYGHSLNPGEETGNVEAVKKFKDYLEKVLRFAESEIKKGVSKEEFINNTSVPGVTEWTGQGLERPLIAAYDELTERK